MFTYVYAMCYRLWHFLKISEMIAESKALSRMLQIASAFTH